MASLNIESWTPDNVAQWIKGLGPQFETSSQSFIDEEITGKALLTINVEYLTELTIENVNDQNAILDAVHCLTELETCLQGETVHGQVVVVNDQTKVLIDKLEQEHQEAAEGDIKTSESSTEVAGQVYQLAKKLLSWLIRSPFSEMNACWPLKDSVCRVVRDMTDESLVKNRDHLQENLQKLQTSFDNFLNEEPLHEVFKQPPILVNEEFTLEGEGLGIGITTSHHIHTVNSVTAESPAGKNGNIKNGDEIVNVNGQCVIAWPQKNVVTLMKSKTDTVSLTLKKLPPVKGPLNKPVDKPGTPLSEVNVIMDRTKVAPERQSRSEMKEAGIKEETSLEMQAIENENAAEEDDKVEDRIEGIKEEVEDEGKQREKEKGKEEVEKVPEKEESKPEEEKVVDNQEAAVKVDEAEKNDAETKTEEDDLVKDDEVEKQEDSTKEVENGQPEKSEEVDEKKSEEVVKNGDEKEETKVEDKVEDKVEVGEAPVVLEDSVAGKSEPEAAENVAVSKDVSGGGGDEEKVEVNEDVKDEAKEQEGVEEKTEKQDGEDKVVMNGEEPVEIPEKAEKNEVKETEKPQSKAVESEPTIAIKVDSPSPKKEVAKASVTQNGENGTTSKKEPDQSKASPSKKPALPKMKMGSVKNVTVGGASAKQVEVYGNAQVVRREKKINGAPNKRISCIELGEADCEGWLTKRSGGHGITPTRWRRQWCVLKEEHLYYYKTSFDREAGGVIEITGYNMSPALEIKKPFAFKCEKEGGKKYFFHADNEVDREQWIKTLNSASRGERKLRETGAAQMNEAAERKAGAALKPAQSNRPRTGSVLAGIRFNYYDDEDVEKDRKPTHEPSEATTTAQRVNEGVLNGQKDEPKPSTEEDTTAAQNVLKIAVGVEDSETCQVVPVEETKDDKGTDVDTKGSSEEGVKSESQEKESEQQPKGESSTSVGNVEQKDSEATSEVSSKTDQPIETPVIQGDKEGKVSTNEDKSGPKEVDGETKGEVVTQEVNGEASTASGDSGETMDAKSGGTIEDVEESKTVEDKKSEPEVNGQTETADVVANTSEVVPAKSEDDAAKAEECAVKSEDETAKSENLAAKSEDDTKKCEDNTTCPEDVTTKPEDDSEKSEDCAAKPEDVTTKPEDDSEKSEDCAAESEDVTNKPEDNSEKSEDCAAKSEDVTTKPEDNSEKSEVVTTKPENDSEKSEDCAAKCEDDTTKCEDEAKKSEDVAGISEEKTKDEFQEVAESIQEAEIGIDGTEKSPQALLRRLSVNSKSEIMDKVVQLRVLRQNLKDKEQSMDAINELLSSDVTPESIAEWREKYESVKNSNDLNENSQL